MQRHYAAVAVAIATVMATAASRPPQWPSDGLVVSTGWWAEHERDPDVALLQVDATDSGYRGGHIPGARLVRYGRLAIDRDGNSTELPDVDSVKAVLESLGISTITHVVLSGSPLLVARAFFTLDYVGVARLSVMDGGVTAWRAEGRAVTTAEPPATRGRFGPVVRSSALVSADWIVQRPERSHVALIDTRREDEFAGTGSGSAGHIAGARRVDWQQFFTSTTDLALKSPTALKQLWATLVPQPGDTVVSYCRTGHRAAATYLIARLLGYRVALYDGSYEDWARRGLPLEGR